MIERIRKDPIVSFLLKKCSLTEAQLDTVIVSQIDADLESKTELRETKKVTKGSFVRTLRQGQNNIESSMYTLLLLGYLGLVPPEKFKQFVRTGELISRVKDSHPDTESIERLLSAMEDFVEGFSGKRKVIL